MAVQTSGGIMADINITPLVDVMLVLLIIFMVAAPVMEKERSRHELEENRDKQQRLVALNLPALENPDNPKTQSKSVAPIVLAVSGNLAVSLDGNNVADCSAHAHTADKSQWVPCLDKIESAIRSLPPEAIDAGVTVDAEPNVSFGFVVGIMHRVHRAGAEKVSMFPKT